MQYPGAHGSVEEDAVVNVDALQVLAATASNDELRERYHDDQSNSSQSDKSRYVNSDDDDSRSRNSTGSSGSDGVSVSKRTGLRKGKWTVSFCMVFIVAAKHVCRGTRCPIMAH